MILTITMNPTVDRTYYLDDLILGQVNRVREKTVTPGGKGINVSKVLRLLDEATTASGFIGGSTGDFIAAFMANMGIDTKFVRLREETRTCVSIKADNAESLTEILESGGRVSADKRDEFLSLVNTLLPQCTVVVLAGSLPPGIDSTMYPALINAAKKAQKTVILDTSGEALKFGIDAKPDVIKPNRTELAQLLGRPIPTQEDVLDAIDEVQRNGIPTVIVSLGGEGAVFADNNGIYKGVPPRIPIVNTVGCGDSLVAGYAKALVRGYPPEETARLAIAVSAANALSMEPGHFEASALKDMLNQTIVERLR